MAPLVDGFVFPIWMKPLKCEEGLQHPLWFWELCRVETDWIKICRIINGGEPCLVGSIVVDKKQIFLWSASRLADWNGRIGPTIEDQRSWTRLHSSWSWNWRNFYHFATAWGRWSKIPKQYQFFKEVLLFWNLSSHCLQSNSAVPLCGMRIDYSRAFGRCLRALESCAVSVLASPREIKPASSFGEWVSSCETVEAGQDIGYGATYIQKNPNGSGRFLMAMMAGIPEMQNFHVPIKGEFCPIVTVLVRLLFASPEELSPRNQGLPWLDARGRERNYGKQREAARLPWVINYEVVCLDDLGASVTIQVKNTAVRDFPVEPASFMKRKREITW